MSRPPLEHQAPGPGQPDIVGYVAVLAATACWGTSGVFVKLILADQQVSALALAFWRDLATFLVLLIGLRLLRPAWLTVKRRDLLWFAALGAAIGVFHIVWNLAVFLNGAAVATVQQAAMPAIVALLAWLIWREPLTRRKVLAIILTFVGTIFVSGVLVLGQTDITLAGFLVGVATPTMYAGWNLLMKQIRGAHNSFTTLTCGFGFAALVLLPVQFFTPQPASVSPALGLHFTGLILLATVGGFSIYTFALGRLQASVATILAMAEIPVVALYAYVLLGERMTAEQIFGSFLVVGGVLMLYRRRSRPRSVPAPRPDTG
ncbi:MAG: DMT family transporter [Chloroflexota bacterium]